MVEERRRHYREARQEIAYITGDGSSIRCTIVNISPMGAAIEVPDAAYIRPRFKLKTENDGVVRDCRIVWIQKNRIGIEFMS
jgi:hypothetical protein